MTQGTAVLRGLAVLRERNFRRFFLGYATSLFGSSMATVAIAFAVLDSGGTASTLGLVLATIPLCQLISMLYGGVLADRLGPRRVMLAGDTVRCCAQAAFATVVLTHHAHLWVLVLLQAVRGTGEGFFSPGLSALVVRTTSRDHLGNANAVLGLAQSSAKIAGPALSGVLVALTNPGWVIAIDAATYGVSLVALALLRIDVPPGGRGRTMRRDVAQGWAEFRSRPWLLATTVQFTSINLLTWGPFLVLGPTLAHERAGGARDWGLVIAAYGAGSLLGGLAVLGRRPARPVAVATIATFGYAIPGALFALQAHVLVIAVGACVAGVGSTVCAALSDTATQQNTPAGVLARVRTFQTFGAFSLGPIAFAAAGPVAAVAGIRTVLAFGAAWAVVGTALVLALPGVRAVRWSTPASNVVPASTAADRTEPAG